MRNHFVALFCVLISMPFLGSAQDSLAFDLVYDIHRVNPSIVVTKENLKDAKTISDLNPYYKRSWVRDFVSIDVQGVYNGRIKKAIGINDTLTQEQKEIMVNADPGKEIYIVMKYMPENTLTHNDLQDFSFSFYVDPEQEATYPGGDEALKNYLLNKVIEKVSLEHFKKYQLAAVKFIVSEDGQILDPHLFSSTEDEKTDKILLESICNMPSWKPAEYSSGLKTQQEFVLTVGDIQSCIAPLLNIGLPPLEEEEEH